jgi:hypothetical protein
METEQHPAKKPVGDWEIRKEIKKVPGIQWKLKYTLPESVEHSKGCIKGKVYSYKSLQ